MAEAKTKRHAGSVTDFLNTIEDERKRRDSHAVLEMMREVTGEEPALWGPNIVGFGSYSYTYASGHSGDWPVVAFSPRKANLTIYIMPGFERYEDLMARLGKHSTGKSCLYIKKLDDVDVPTLRELITRSVEVMTGQAP